MSCHRIPHEAGVPWAPCMSCAKDSSSSRCALGSLHVMSKGMQMPMMFAMPPPYMQSQFPAPIQPQVEGVFSGVFCCNE